MLLFLQVKVLLRSVERGWWVGVPVDLQRHGVCVSWGLDGGGVQTAGLWTC
jgi:hypothetical protein